MPGAVGRIFIHLEAGRDPSSFSPLGALVVPVRGAYQLSLALHALGLLDADAVRQARDAVRTAPGRRAQDPVAMRDDAIKRGLITQTGVMSLKF